MGSQTGHAQNDKSQRRVRSKLPGCALTFPISTTLTAPTKHPVISSTTASELTPSSLMTRIASSTVLVSDILTTSRFASLSCEIVWERTAEFLSVLDEL